MALGVTVTDQVIHERLTQVLEPRFAPTEFRLSETGACPRLRVLRVLGYEPEPHGEDEARYFERGHVAEDWVVAQYRRKYPRRTRRQVPVKTPWGDVGHIDLWVAPERRIVEVKSVGKTVFDHDIPRAADLDQVQAYLHFWRGREGTPRTDDAELVYVDMDTFRTRVLPVKRDICRGAFIETRLAELHLLAANGKLPPVEHFPDEPPCQIQTAAGPRKCGFWRHCHAEGSEFSFDIVSDEGFEGCAAEYLAVEEQIQALQKAAEERIKPLKDRLNVLRALIETGLDNMHTDQVEAGGYRIKRVAVPGHITWDVDAAIDAHVIGPDVVAVLTPFCREGKGYTRLYVRKGTE